MQTNEPPNPIDKTVLTSVFAYGAVGDGLTDDGPAISAALAASSQVNFPAGTFRVASPIIVPANCFISGAGQNTIIQADNNNYDVFQVNQSYVSIKNLKIQNGLAGIRFIGLAQPVVQNSVEDVGIWNANYGLLLDGGNSLNRPCYWNNFNRVLVAQPNLCGIYLTKSGNGDTPNANTFHACRVYSLGVNISGDGIFVEYGNYRNSFIDCEANLSTSANSCIRLGANANKTVLVNPYTETTGAVTNILLDSGSGSTAPNMIINHMAASAGAAIVDNSGGNFVSMNSPSTSSGAQNYFKNLNIGFPIQVTSNTLASQLQIHGLSSNTANGNVFIYLNNSVGARFGLNKSRSTTLGNQGAVVNNDDIGYFDFNASDNSHFLAAAQLKASVDGSVTPGGGAVPGRLSLMTMPPSGAGLLEALRLDSAQNVIFMQSKTPASSSAAGTAGTISWDANFLYVCVSLNTWKRVAISTW